MPKHNLSLVTFSLAELLPDFTFENKIVRIWAHQSGEKDIN